MFKKVLIANRGEIACRIIRTCRRLGIATVAVYSDADATSRHVMLADEAVRLGPPPPRESYLNIERVIAAARRTGAEMVHPGYGFLSENGGFAHACAEAGLIFVGPRPEAMHAMGDKLRARAMAREAGVPTPPGSEEVDEASAVVRAREIGFPVLIKASAGGGGIGIQAVESEERLVEVLQRARNLALNAFGSGVVYLEKYIEGASHIEAQVLGDQYGNVVHLFERDCSIQRRNQKVIEEATSVKLTDPQREALLGHAVALARRIGYSNAGTMEFLYKDGQFFFLEMNTRLQVEHPVTEMVTGLDLVELQLRVASGEPLPFQQGDIRCRGHAVEARVYAEDPVQGLMPSAGLITRLHEPADMPNVRVDGFLAEGYEVTPFYDPMLAKVIAWGETRSAAVHSLDAALGEYQLEGLSTNIELLRRILREPAFVLGRFSTRTLSEMLEREEEDSIAVSSGHGTPVGASTAAAAAVAALLLEQGRKRSGPAPGDAWRTYGRRMGHLGGLFGTRGW